MLPKENEPLGLKTDHFYRCLPTLCEANIIGSYLADLDSTYLQFFDLKDFSLHKRIKVLGKEDQYCAQMTSCGDNLLVIFGVDKLIVFNVQEMAIVETIKISYYIEKIETRNGYVVIMTSD